MFVSFCCEVGRHFCFTFVDLYYLTIRNILLLISVLHNENIEEGTQEDNYIFM